MDPVGIAISLVGSAIQLTRDIIVLVKEHKSLPGLLGNYKTELKRINSLIAILQAHPDFQSEEVKKDIDALCNLAKELKKDLGSIKDQIKDKKVKDVFKKYFTGGGDGKKDMDSLISRITGVKTNIIAHVSLASYELLVQLKEDGVVILANKVEEMHKLLKDAVGQGLPLMNIVHAGHKDGHGKVSVSLDEYYRFRGNSPPEPGVHRIRQSDTRYLGHATVIEPFMIQRGDEAPRRVERTEIGNRMDNNAIHVNCNVRTEGAPGAQSSSTEIISNTYDGNCFKIGGTVTGDFLASILAPRIQAQTAVPKRV